MSGISVPPPSGPEYPENPAHRWGAPEYYEHDSTAFSDEQNRHVSPAHSSPRMSAHFYRRCSEGTSRAATLCLGSPHVHLRARWLHGYRKAQSICLVCGSFPDLPRKRGTPTIDPETSGFMRLHFFLGNRRTEPPPSYFHFPKLRSARESNRAKWDDALQTTNRTETTGPSEHYTDTVFASFYTTFLSC